MSVLYDPDASVQPNTTWDITFLSDRDVSAQVPINYVPHPGANLTPVCFGNGTYDDGPAANCISNLLASQVRRYVIDLYWDVANHGFSLCPIELPASNDTSITSSSSTLATNAVLQSETSATLTRSLNARQADITRVLKSLSASPLPQATSASSYSVVSSTNARTLFQLGQYRCSNTLSVGSVTSIFSDYLARTSDTLQARIYLIIVNLHVARPIESSNATSPILTPSDLPNASQLVNTFFQNLDSVLYRPGDLLTDRLSLNASWFRRASTNEAPLTNYYTLYKASNGDLATTDGWPDEGYIQSARGRRVLVGFGTVDEGLRAYDVSQDGDRIFPPGYISAPSNAVLNTNATLSQGCFYRDNTFDLSQVNNSWAVSTVNIIDPPDLGSAADNLTTCGISPILNTTINGQTADINAQPYREFGNDAIFSWAYGQPQNDTDANTNAAAKYRCALMVSNDAYRGHWRVEYCNQRYRAACREANSPYRWRISSYRVDYEASKAACTGNTSFDVPRTGLENDYLWHHILSDAETDSSLLDGVWINFNALRVENCWVTTGVNGTCPYFENPDAVHTREILIPTIAALIVLILTVLTILVKCSNNARNSRKIRRGDGGWDYEGVPS